MPSPIARGMEDAHRQACRAIGLLCGMMAKKSMRVELVEEAIESLEKSAQGLRDLIAETRKMG